MRFYFLMLSTLLFLSIGACSNNSTESSNNESPTNKVNSQNQAFKTTELNIDNSKYKSTEISMSISGAGASFPAIIYDKWAEEYKQSVGGKVSYQAIGSSAGIEQIIKKTVDFGASDIPLKQSELTEKGLIQFPTVIGGITPIINIKGIKSNQMVLDGQILSKIYLGKITQWNDSDIVRLNPNLDLPNEKIITVHRSDGSGTTFNFSHYLTQVSSEWKIKGFGKKVQWPIDGIEALNNDGVANVVKSNRNSIGYIDYAYAKQNNLVYTSMKNSSGNIVKPSHKSFLAASNVAWNKTSGLYKIITNSGNKDAWPIATTTFILVNQKPENPKQVAGVLNFFNWAYMKGYKSAVDLDFVPFSDQSVATFFTEWDKIVDNEGNPIYEAKSVN